MDNPLGAVNVPDIINNLNNIPAPYDPFWTNYLTNSMISPRALERYIQLNKTHQKCTLFKGTKRHHTVKNFILFIKDKEKHCINCHQSNTCTALESLELLYCRLGSLACAYKLIPQGRRVSDELENVLPTWRSHFPIFISAPTGSGKNWFVQKVLIPYANERNQAVVIFSNRLALSAQQKRELARLYDRSKVGYPDWQLINESVFGNCLILSYQSAIKYLKNMGTPGFPPASIGYAIFDEAHFFIADATFNPNTENILYSLQSRFKDAVRIYMTATPDKCYRAINEGEAALYYINDIPHRRQDYIRRRTFEYYNFARSFKNYNIKFFTDYKQIEDLIKSDLENSKSNDKWLHFVTSKRRGQSLAASLKKFLKEASVKDSMEHLKNVTVTYLDANLSTRQRSEHPDWKAIYQERCPSRIIVSTTVIDNGINLPDTTLKNIVVSSHDMISMFQMIGRKRCTSEERINLYIAIPTKQQIESLLQHTERLLNAINDFINKRTRKFLQSNWGVLPYDIQKLFYVTNKCKLELNYFARYKLQLQSKQYQEWSRIMNQDDYELVFVQMVLNWFGMQPQDLIPFLIGKTKSLTARRDLEALLKAHLDKPMLSSYFLSDFYPMASTLIKDVAASSKVTLQRSDSTREISFLNTSFDKLSFEYKIDGTVRPLGRRSKDPEPPPETALCVRLRTI